MRSQSAKDPKSSNTGGGGAPGWPPQKPTNGYGAKGSIGPSNSDLKRLVQLACYFWETKEHDLSDHPGFQKLVKDFEQLFNAQLDKQKNELLDFLSDRAVEYGITDAEMYSRQHPDEPDQMMIPLSAVTKLRNEQ